MKDKAQTNKTIAHGVDRRLHFRNHSALSLHWSETQHLICPTASSARALAGGSTDTERLTCASHGILLDEDGKAMSGSHQNGSIRPQSTNRGTAGYVSIAQGQNGIQSIRRLVVHAPLWRTPDLERFSG